MQKDKRVSLEKLPEKLRRAVVKLMAAEGIDVGEALDRTALLTDKNYETWDSELNAKANSLYKSRHMSELNKTRAEWDRQTVKRLKEEYWKGYNEGMKWVKEVECTWHVPCSICGKSMDFYTWDPGFAEAYATLKKAFANWHHTDCVETS